MNVLPSRLIFPWDAMNAMYELFVKAIIRFNVCRENVTMATTCVKFANKHVRVCELNFEMSVKL